MTTAAPAQILGRHVWSELMTTDVKGAEDFYKRVIGWTAEPFPNSPNPYIQFKRPGGAGAAGLMERPAGMNMPPFWSMYIAVPDLDEMAGHFAAARDEIVAAAKAHGNGGGGSGKRPAPKKRAPKARERTASGG